MIVVTQLRYATAFIYIQYGINAYTIYAFRLCKVSTSLLGAVKYGCQASQGTYKPSGPQSDDDRTGLIITKLHSFAFPRDLV